MRLSSSIGVCSGSAVWATCIVCVEFGRVQRTDVSFGGRGRWPPWALLQGWTFRSPFHPHILMAPNVEAGDVSWAMQELKLGPEEDVACRLCGEFGEDGSHSRA